MIKEHELKSKPDEVPGHTAKDFMSTTVPKWCPGCGDHAVFKALTNVFSTLDTPKENFVMVSGIGCSSRFPYYVDTYGFHSIHGRAPTMAMGMKLVRPDLSVWVVTGDGDALSIGGNHFTHLMRRNPDIKVILFNNQIYGLTKGQVSPTSPVGLKTKTTPFGSIETPVRPLAQAIAVGATFAARITYTDVQLMKEVFTAAAHHRGVAIIEVLINCVIFTEGIFDAFIDKDKKADNTVKLQHGKPLIFGKNNEKGIVLKGFKPEVVTIGENGITEKDLFVHDASVQECSLAYILSSMSHPECPLPLGIFRQVSAPTYEDMIRNQEEAVKKELGEGKLTDLLRSGETWVIDERGKVVQNG